MVAKRFTRTVNPLQFDALEPKRFEDLVRQLLHDFRGWRQLEATGRLGGDDGFDARGWEIVGGAQDPIDEIDDESVEPIGEDRIWLVQCKRERKITPKKLIGHLESIQKAELAGLHGLILVACAEFSKRSRDEFRAWCLGHNIREFYLWGKAELEDALFLPINDGLLFAYFGLSLAIRRRSEQARLRAQTTVKRKLKRFINSSRCVLLRSPDDERYPYWEGDESECPWWFFDKPTLTHRGFELQARRYFAFIDDDGEHWDYANLVNDARLDPWGGLSPFPDRQELFEFWKQLGNHNQAWMEVRGIIPYDRVLEVDEIGDDVTNHPHVYINPSNGESRPFQSSYATLPNFSRWQNDFFFAQDKRVTKFPAKFRKRMPWESPAADARR